jgi:hypothetical protein
MTPTEKLHRANAIVRSTEDRRKRMAAMWDGEQERRSGTERRAVPTAGQLLWCTKLPNPGFIPPSTEGKYMGNTFTPADDLRLED